MIRVYMINLSFGLAGVERRFANLWRLLLERNNVDAVLVVPSILAKVLREGNLIPDDNKGLIEIHVPRLVRWLSQLRMPSTMSTARDILMSRIVAFGFYKFLLKTRSDRDMVLHIGMPTSALRPPDVPTVYECMDSTFLRLTNKIYKRAAKRRVIIHCQTERIKNHFDEAHKVKMPRWKTVANPTYFASYSEVSNEITRNFELIAFVGRLTSIKNPLLFLEALAIARRKGTNCKALILGEGPLRAEVDSLILKLGLKEYVDIRFTVNAPCLLSSAAIYVTLQTGDNYGSQALLEAMAAGCAVVASNVGETPKLITPEVGECVELNADAIADAIVKMVMEPDLTRRRGEAASKRARTEYSGNAYAEYLENLYLQALKFH